MFGCNDEQTCELIAKKLGRKKIIRKLNGHESREAAELAASDAIARELSLQSTLQYVIPPHLPPMKLDRLAHTKLTTKEEASFSGLPLRGHYEE